MMVLSLEALVVVEGFQHQRSSQQLSSLSFVAHHKPISTTSANNMDTRLYYRDYKLGGGSGSGGGSAPDGGRDDDNEKSHNRKKNLFFADEALSSTTTNAIFEEYCRQRCCQTTNEQKTIFEEYCSQRRAGRQQTQTEEKSTTTTTDNNHKANNNIVVDNVEITKKIQKFIEEFDPKDCEYFGHVIQPKKEEPPITVADIWQNIITGELAAKSLPIGPSADLSSVEVIQSILRGLQYNNIPAPNSGIRRSYQFMNIYAIKEVIGLQYGSTEEERTEEFFVEKAQLSPRLLPFINAKSISFGPITSIPGTPTRGEICTMPVNVTSVQSTEWQNAHTFVPTNETTTTTSSTDSSSSFEESEEETDDDDGIATSQQQGKEDNEVPKTPTPPGMVEKIQTFSIRLEKQRRPPLQGCYIITNIIDIQTVPSISRLLNKE